MKASTLILVLSTIGYILMMSMVVIIEDFFLRMYGQMAAGSLYIFLSAIALHGRYSGMDEFIERRVAEERRIREMYKRLNKRKFDEQKKIKTKEEGSP